MATATLERPTQKPAPAITPSAAEPQKQAPAEAHFRLIKSETLLLTRAAAIDAAKAHQELPESPTERELLASHVEDLNRRIRSKVWLPCAWATVTYHGTKFRMNGQHSSRAMIDSGDFLPDRVAIHLDHFEVDTQVGMGILFRQFDARFSSRSKKDIAGAYWGLIPGLSDVPRKKAKLGIEGVVWYERNFEGLPAPSGDDVYTKLLVATYHQFLHWLSKILVHGKTRELEKTAVAAAMYGTFLKSENASQEFWSHVAKSDLPDDSDPRAVLAAELTAAINPEARQPLKPGDCFIKCQKAWNAFRSGEKIRTLNVNAKKGYLAFAD